MNKLFLFSFLFAGLILAGCLNLGSAVTAEKGDLVSVDYLGSLTNGQVFDTNIPAEAQKAHMPVRPSYEPLNFTVGSHQVIKGFEDGVVGMKVGEEKTLTILPAEGYGERNAGLVVTVPRDRIQGEPSVGMKISSPQGQSGRITAVDNSTVTVDFNHPLAGQTLIFKVTMRAITKKPSLVS